jgi:hypothetical protein
LTISSAIAASLDAMRQVPDRIDFLNGLNHYDYVLLQIACPLETILAAARHYYDVDT